MQIKSVHYKNSLTFSRSLLTFSGSSLFHCKLRLDVESNPVGI